MNLDWTKTQSLLPTIIQDHTTGAVLMLGYMNEESLSKTIETNQVWFYSRSKQRLWMKGEESGNVLTVVSIQEDCDNDTLLINVQPAGPTCHTGEVSCFGQTQPTVIAELYQVIADRKNNPSENSYTSSLFNAGLEQIVSKVNEETAEVIQAVEGESDQRVIEETVDVLYHLFVLLNTRDINWFAIQKEIFKRRK